MQELNELFDNPYALTMDSKDADTIKNSMRDGGISKIMCYAAKEDPTQIFALAFINNAWEVHHFQKHGLKYVSGENLKLDKKDASRFISTALFLYKNRLDRGNNIRVVGHGDSWNTYVKVILNLVKKYPGKYIVSDVDKNYIGGDGHKYNAISINKKLLTFEEYLGRFPKHE